MQLGPAAGASGGGRRGGGQEEQEEDRPHGRHALKNSRCDRMESYGAKWSARSAGRRWPCALRPAGVAG